MTKVVDEQDVLRQVSEQVIDEALAEKVSGILYESILERLIRPEIVREEKLPLTIAVSVGPRVAAMYGVALDGPLEVSVKVTEENTSGEWEEDPALAREE